jgi:hypothetical protein
VIELEKNYDLNNIVKDIHLTHGLVFRGTAESAKKVLEFMSTLEDIFLVYRKHTPDKLRIITEEVKVKDVQFT